MRYKKYSIHLEPFHILSCEQGWTPICGTRGSVYTKCFPPCNQCTKNKSMIQIPTHALFLTCAKRLLFVSSTHNVNKIISRCRLSTSKMCSLTSKGSLLLMVVNPHPPWSLACSQLPLCPLLPPHPRTHFPPKGHLFAQVGG